MSARSSGLRPPCPWQSPISSSVHRTAPCTSPWAAGRASRPSIASCGTATNPSEPSRPRPRRRLHLHRPAVRIDDALHEAQPEAAPRDAGGDRRPPAEERLEQPRAVGGRDAGAPITDGEAHDATRLRPRLCGMGLAAGLGAYDADFDDAFGSASRASGNASRRRSVLVADVALCVVKIVPLVVLRIAPEPRAAGRWGHTY